MKRVYTFILSGLMAAQLMAGGIVTNTNQSAQFVRLLSRNASTQIDATYFNPAGLVLLDNGFHLSLNNQTIFQEKTVTTTFPYLNNQTYIGDVSVPFFPTFFAVYKKDKLAISLGFGPNGGGGSAEYKTGLPSFEMPISMIAVGLTQNGIPTTNYSADIYFKGSSVFYGGQLGASYAINDYLSLSAGVRFIYAKNDYEGHIHDIYINPTYPALGANGSMMPATNFFQTIAAAANMAGSSVQPLIDGGGSALTLDQAVGLGYLSQAQADQLSGGLGANYDPSMNIATIQGAYYQSEAIANGNAAATADMDVKATQKGTAFTPIFGINFNLNKKLNIGIKYEMNTKLELTNESDADKDANGMFLNDSTFRSDIPAILAMGIEYSIIENLRVSASWTHYFDKNADWNGKEKFIDKNLYEIALGLEYDISDIVTISAGYMHGQTGVGQGYQTDISFSNSSNTVGFGGRINATEKLSIDLGVLITSYVGAEETKVDENMIPYKETFDKSLTDLSIGINYKF